jgi:hypothetical protein
MIENGGGVSVWHDGGSAHRSQDTVFATGKSILDRSSRTDVGELGAHINADG